LNEQGHDLKKGGFQEPFDDAFGLGFGLMWLWYFEKPTPVTRLEGFDNNFFSP